MSEKENKVQKEVLNYLLRNGVYCWRNNNTAQYDAKLGMYRAFNGKKGVGDILGILSDGRFLSVECKSSTGKASPDQILFVKRCALLGGLCVVVHSLEELKPHIEPYIVR